MKNLILLMSLLCMSAAWAGPLSLETERGKVLIPSLENWELGKDMFGMPFIYFSPQTNGQRSNISFTSTGQDAKVDLVRLSQHPETYKEIKSSWAQTVSAKPLEFHPYRKWKNNHGHAVHEIGFSYLHEEKSYVEHSFYVDCRGKVIYSKSLRLKDNLSHQKDFQKLLQDMDCGV